MFLAILLLSIFSSSSQSDLDDLKTLLNETEALLVAPFVELKNSKFTDIRFTYLNCNKENIDVWEYLILLANTPDRFTKGEISDLKKIDSFGLFGYTVTNGKNKVQCTTRKDADNHFWFDTIAQMNCNGSDV